MIKDTPSNKPGYWTGKKRDAKTILKIKDKLRKNFLFPPQPKVCQFCKKVFKGIGNKFCSYECKGKSQLKLKDLTCKRCGKVTRIKRSRMYAKFCSNNCKNMTHGKECSGEKSNFWKGGVTPINRLIRTSTEYKLWRKSVFERDNYTCIWCGVKGNLEADHIKPFAYFPELRFAIDNGRTLCVPCHKTTDTYGNKYKKKYEKKSKTNSDK